MPRGRTPGRYVGRDRPPPPHGSRSRYTAGCHCDLCTSANRDYQREWMRWNRTDLKGRDEGLTGLTVRELKKMVRAVPGRPKYVENMRKVELVKVLEEARDD